MLTSNNASNEYCMYLRKSRADLEAEARGEGESLARHEQILTALAKKHGLSVTHIYKEIVSGETLEARPEAQKMLEAVNAGKYAGVLVVEVERLARGDTIDQGVIAKSFKYSNTLIITPIKIYDPTNEFDEEYFEFGLFMSRREYKVINRRIQRGRLASVKDGKYISPVAPFGYQRYKLENANGYSLRPDPEESKIVQLIFDMYLNGKDGVQYGSYKIAGYLESCGIVHRGNSSWSAATVRDILKNPVYTGKICWGKRKEVKQIIDGKTVKSRPDNPDYLSVNGLHEAIISDEDFTKVQELMKNSTHRAVSPSKELQNPLSGLIYCKKCGRLMTRLGPNSHSKYATLKCPNRNCSNVSAPLYLVEQVLIESLENWLDNFKISLKEEAKKTPVSEVGVIQNAISEQETHLDGLKKQMNKTYELLEKEVYTIDMFTERHQTLTTQISEADEKLNALREHFNKLQANTLAAEVFIPRVTTVIMSYFDCSTATEKNELLREVLNRIEYNKDQKNTRTTVNNPNFDLILYPSLKDI